MLPSHSTVVGVSNFNGGSNAPREQISSLTSGSYTVANWSDGLPLIGVKDNVGPSNAKRVDLNFFPPSSDAYSSGWSSYTQGTLLMSNALLYVYNTPTFKQPTITSFTPTQTGYGSTVTITGKNLSSTTSVSFGGVTASSFNVVDSNTISATVGYGSSGNVIVKTIGGTASLAGFIYNANAPIISSFSPTSSSKGNAVYIYGSGFTGATSVSFGGTLASSFYVYSDTYMYAYVGSGASGSVSITTPSGIGDLAGFIYMQSPVINSFSPTSASKGTTVTIKGNYFTNATSVYFGGTYASSYTVVNDSTITATIGAGSSGSVSVSNSVSTAYLAGFTYIAPKPVITSFSPTSQSSGNYVDIYGSGFTGATSVSFGGVPATSFYVYSDTYLYAYVGSGASGSVIINTPGGTAIMSGFTYLVAPTITSFSPASATKGATVTIYGSGFTGANTVSFGVLMHQVTPL